MSKEEIEEYKETLEELASDENVYNSIKKAVGGTFKYIEQLENKLKESEERDKKLIEYLERKIGEYDETIIEIVLQNVLSVAKGENDEKDY